MNTQLQNTSTAKSKSAAQASCKTMCVEGVEIGQIFVSSWGWEQTNIDFYQVVGMTAKSLRLREIAKTQEFSRINGEVDFTGGGYCVPVKDQFIGEVVTRRYNTECQSVKLASYSYAYPWNGKPQRFTCYA